MPHPHFRFWHPMGAAAVSSLTLGALFVLVEPGLSASGKAPTRESAGVGQASFQTSVTSTAPVPTTPAFAPTPLQPSVIDAASGLPCSTKIQEWWLPKLLRRGFAGQPINTAKGLASKIKALEVDVPKRKAAAKYLGTVDCQEFPESQERLAELVQDPFEPVRYEAAKAFVAQLSRGHDERPSRKLQRRKDTCRGCCDNMTVLNVITKQAYQCDAQGCWIEPSERVRERLKAALSLCQTCDSQEDSGMPIPLTPTPEGGREATPLLKSPERSAPYLEVPVPVPAPPPVPMNKPKSTPPPERPSAEKDAASARLSAPRLSLPTPVGKTLTEPGYSRPARDQVRPAIAAQTKSESAAPQTQRVGYVEQPAQPPLPPPPAGDTRWRVMSGFQAPQQTATSVPFHLPGGVPQ